ncbi:hypothetical protein ACIQVK_52595 [Streptomyces sp. NPDC090493]|uniref:hypothetical protein n=1 Tax=Streptomyces sp. NPDC090493 TaxID=3365964 RepID=UPI00382DAEA3
MLTLSAWRERFDRLHDTSAVARRTGGQVAGFLAHDHGWYHHTGDLVLPKDTDLDIALVVDGDLVVHGFLDDYASGLGMLVVLGDLVIRDLMSYGALYVGGDLRAQGVVHAHYNDFTFEVAGAVHARALVLDDKFGDYRRGALAVEIDAYDSTPGQLRAAREIFVPEVYEEEDWDADEEPPESRRPSPDRVRARLHAGQPLFKAEGERSG